MGLREFQDGRGGQWRVWDTVTVRADAAGTFRSGWLTFDNGAERRRLAPIPPGGKSCLTSASLSDDGLTARFTHPGDAQWTEVVPVEHRDEAPEAPKPRHGGK